LRLYDSLTGKEVLAVPDPAGPTRSVAFHPDGRRVATGHRDGTVSLREVPSGKVLLHWRHSTQPVHGVAFSPDGGSLAVGHGQALAEGAAGHVAVYGLPATLPAPPELRFQIPGALRAFYHPDGKSLAVVAGDTLRFHDAARGQELDRLVGHDGVVIHAAFRRDGRELASAGSDGTVRTWDTQTGTPLRTLRSHT
jgi:WD40 repeat protein